MIDFKGSQVEKEIILGGVRWYGAYPISYRQLEEMMQERGVSVDHATLNRWVIKYAPEGGVPEVWLHIGKGLIFQNIHKPNNTSETLPETGAGR